MSLSMPEQYDALLRTVSRRRFIAGATAAGAATALGGPMLWRRPARAAEVPGQAPHLQYGTDPRSAMTVSWMTPVAATGTYLRYREIGGGDWSDNHYAVGKVVRRLGVDVLAPEYHHVSLSGLAADTAYEYVLGEPSSDALTGTFSTAPEAGPFAFTAFGDQGTDGASNGTRPSSMTNAIAAEGAAFHFHVGDLCYANRTGMGHDERIPDDLNTQVVDPKVWDTWLADITRVAAHRPWMPTVGNHEMEPGYGLRGYETIEKRFALPGNGAPPANVDDPMVTYSFDYGNVRFIALDANDANYEIPANHGYLTSQDAWLTERLASARAEGSGIDWIVVGYHQCSYCTNLLHASDQGLRDRWDGLFEAHQVDLVINGHNHSYERAHPKLAEREGPLYLDRPEVVDPRTDGTTFITAGCGGSPRLELSAHPLAYVNLEGGLRAPEPALWSVTRYLDLSFIRVEVDPEGQTMTVTAKAVAPMLPLPGRGAGVVDQVVLTRSGTSG